MLHQHIYTRNFQPPVEILAHKNDRDAIRKTKLIIIDIGDCKLTCNCVFPAGLVFND